MALYSLNYSVSRYSRNYSSWFMYDINKRPVHPYGEEFNSAKAEQLEVVVKDGDSLEADKLAWFDDATKVDVFIVQNHNLLYYKHLVGSDVVRHMYYIRMNPDQRQDIVIRQRKKESDILLKKSNILGDLGSYLFQEFCLGKYIPKCILHP